MEMKLGAFLSDASKKCGLFPNLSLSSRAWELDFATERRTSVNTLVLS